MGQGASKRVGKKAASAAASTTGLVSLKYASVLSGSLAEAERSLAQILACALKNNPKLQITGMLYYNRETQGLIQVLEGPEGAVRDLYERIVADDRHSGCKVLEQKELDSRVYSDFGMALAHTADPAREAERAEMMATGGSAFGEHLIRLQYSSTLKADDAERGRELLRDILAEAVRNNSERQIGGILCYNPNTNGVVQVLEGPAGPVRELFLTIQADGRHKDCCLTGEELLLNRSEYIFGASWGMLQSETQEAGALLDLSSRVRTTYHARAGSAAVEEGKAAVHTIKNEALQKAVDETIGVETTPDCMKTM